MRMQVDGRAGSYLYPQPIQVRKIKDANHQRREKLHTREGMHAVFT